jgi:hypothetical protein
VDGGGGGTLHTWYIGPKWVYLFTKKLNSSNKKKKVGTDEVVFSSSFFCLMPDEETP